MGGWELRRREPEWNQRSRKPEARSQKGGPEVHKPETGSQKVDECICIFLASGFWLPFPKMFLLLRNLRYFRGVNIAVVIGMAVATAVLTGALMVGDSVRGSLADLARQRLGAVDVALISTRFFDRGLAARLRERQGPGVAAI